MITINLPGAKPPSLRTLRSLHLRHLLLIRIQMLQISEKDKAQFLEEAPDPRKVTLVCGIHKYSYGSKRKPNFRFKQCSFVNSMGLIANTPPERRTEMLEMFEFTVNKLVEAAKN